MLLDRYLPRGNKKDVVAKIVVTEIDKAHGNKYEIAAAMEIPLLGEIPLVQSIAEGSDNGQPVSLWTGTETPESTAFMQLAERTIAELCKLKNH